MSNNPRWVNATFRKKARERMKKTDSPCMICRGALGPIHYDEPMDAAHPLSLCIDEIRPVSLWRQFGYDSAAQAAADPNNIQSAHRICNAKKGAKVNYTLQVMKPAKIEQKQEIKTSMQW
jgi:hypothetical protein